MGNGIMLIKWTHYSYCHLATSGSYFSDQPFLNRKWILNLLQLKRKYSSFITYLMMFLASQTTKSQLEGRIRDGKRCRGERAASNLMYKLCICSNEWPRKGVRILRQNSWCPRQDLNKGPPKCKCEMLLSESMCSVKWGRTSGKQSTIKFPQSFTHLNSSILVTSAEENGIYINTAATFHDLIWSALVDENFSPSGGGTGNECVNRDACKKNNKKNISLRRP